MKRTFNLAVIITVVLSVATVAFAVAGTSRLAPSERRPVMVTDRAAVVAAIGGGCRRHDDATAHSGTKPPATAGRDSPGSSKRQHAQVEVVRLDEQRRLG